MRHLTRRCLSTHGYFSPFFIKWISLLTPTLAAWPLRDHTALKSILWETLFLDQLHCFSLLSLNSFLHSFLKSKVVKKFFVTTKISFTKSDSFDKSNKITGINFFIDWCNKSPIKVHKLKKWRFKILYTYTNILAYFQFPTVNDKG